MATARTRSADGRSNASAGRTGPAPTIVLAGFGRVGRAFARQLLPSTGVEPSARLRVVAIADSRGALVDPQGVDLNDALRQKESTGRLRGPSFRRWTTERALEELRPELLVEASIADPVHGDPGTRHVLRALDGGTNVVTSNKGPFALRFAEVEHSAVAHRCAVRFGTTVGGAVPVLEILADRLRGAGVTAVRGIVNGTTQFLLSELGRGKEFVDALDHARRLGLTEPDPAVDLSGLDSAYKATILHNVAFGQYITPEQVDREPLDTLAVSRIRATSGGSQRIVSMTEVVEGHAAVRFIEVPRGGPWDLTGPENRFEIETRRLGTLSLQGLGAGPEAIAAALVSDVYEALGFVRQAGAPPLPLIEVRPAHPVASPPR